MGWTGEYGCWCGKGGSGTDYGWSGHVSMVLVWNRKRWTDCGCGGQVSMGAGVEKGEMDRLWMESAK